MSKATILKALAVTNKVCGGAELDQDVADVFVRKLEMYDEPAVLEALDVCMEDHQGRLSLKAIIDRVKRRDEWPDPEQAWAMCPRSESDTVVWTTEIAQSFELVRTMVDKIAARVAFKEEYSKRLDRARSEQRKPNWEPSLGQDYSGRRVVLEEAVAKGRLSQSQSFALLRPKEEEQLAHGAPKQLGGYGNGMVKIQAQQCGECKHFWIGYVECPECGADNPSKTWNVEARG